MSILVLRRKFFYNERIVELIQEGALNWMVGKRLSEVIEGNQCHFEGDHLGTVIGMLEVLNPTNLGKDPMVKLEEE